MKIKHLEIKKHLVLMDYHKFPLTIQQDVLSTFLPLPLPPCVLCAHSDADHIFVDLAYKINAIVSTLKCIYLSIISA